MGWSLLQRREARGRGKIPPEGIRITSCGRDAKTRYIGISFGDLLARRLDWSGEQFRARVMIGTGQDRGKLAFSADAAGQFKAKRYKFGDYRIIINTASARGEFLFDFEPIEVETVELIHPAAQGGAKRAVITVPRGLLAEPKIAEAA